MKILCLRNARQPSAARALRWLASLAVVAYIVAANAAIAATVEMVAPASLINQVIVGGQTGTVYSTDAAGYFAAQQSDVLGFLADGFTLPPPGLSPTPLKLLEGKNAAGTTLGSSASAGEFGISSTPGTSESLAGEAAESNTKTDHVIWEYVLPANYHAGQNLTLTCHGDYSGSGTAGTVTIAGAAYLTAAAGTQGSTLIATAAQNLTASDAAYAFTITGTTLSPGSRLILEVTEAIQETGGSATLTGALNSCTVG